MKKLFLATLAILLLFSILTAQSPVLYPDPPGGDGPPAGPNCQLVLVCECWYDPAAKQDVCYIFQYEVCE